MFHFVLLMVAPVFPMLFANLCTCSIKTELPLHANTIKTETIKYGIIIIVFKALKYAFKHHKPVSYVYKDRSKLYTSALELHMQLSSDKKERGFRYFICISLFQTFNKEKTSNISRNKHFLKRDSFSFTSNSEEF